MRREGLGTNSGEKGEESKKDQSERHKETKRARCHGRLRTSEFKKEEVVDRVKCFRKTN